MSTQPEQSNVRGRKLSDLQRNPENDPNELLKDRFLCYEGVLGLYGQTGIGKSSLAMQMMIQWALGREAFGMIPARPLKSLLIQAENDDGDIAEMRDGIIAGYGLTPEEANQACGNIIVIQEDSQIESEFFLKTVKPALEVHKPDILWIDPALSYLGGDTASQEIVGHFLRGLLKPLLRQYHCACVVVHHMNKSGNSDNAYAGSGSAEWGNMPRAVLILRAKGKAFFELIAAKRANRLNWTMPDGVTWTNSKTLEHSTIQGRIFWLEVGEELIAESQSKQTIEDQEGEVLKRVPEAGSIEKNALAELVRQEANIGINKTKKMVNTLIKEKRLFEIEVPRGNARPSLHVCRLPPPKGVTAGCAQVENGHVQPSSTAG